MFTLEAGIAKLLQQRRMCMATLISLLSVLLLTGHASSSCPDQTRLPLNLLLLTTPQHCHVPETGRDPSNGWVSCSQEEDGGIEAAVRLAVARVNQNCSILQDYVLNVTLHSSSECGRSNGLDALHQGLFDGTVPDVAVLGAGCSRATEAVAQQAKYYTLPVVSYASISGDLADKDRFPYFARTIPSGDLVAGGVASVIQYYNWKKLVVITENSPEFIRMTDQLKEHSPDVDLIEIEFPSSAAELEATNFFPGDSRIFVLNVGVAIARWFLCEVFSVLLHECVGGEGATGLAKQAVEFPQASRNPDWKEYPSRYVLLLQGWYEGQWWEEDEREGEGEGEEGYSQVNCTSDQLLEFLYHQRALAVNHYPVGLDQNAMINDSPDQSQPLSQLARFAYDAVWTVALSLQGGTNWENFDPLDSDVENRTRMADGFSRRLNEVSFEGLTGTVTFENGSRYVDRVRVFQYRNGSAPQTETIYILRGSGAEELFSFEYVEGETNETVWPGGVPSDGTIYTEVERFPYLWLWVISYIVNSVVIFTALFCLFFTCIFHNRKLIKLTSPNLNYIIIAGVITFCLGAILFSYPPVSRETLQAICGLRMWLISIGVTLCYGMINAKMGRIYHIFHRPTPKKRAIKDWHLVMFVLAMIVIDLIILIPSTVVEEARFSPTHVPDAEHPGNFTNDNGTFTYVVSLCTSPWRLHLLAVLFGYKGIVQVIGLVLAFLMRNVKIKVLNDSREISYTLYLSSITLFAVIVISFIYRDHLNIYSASYCFGVPLSCMAVLIVVFFTKMVRLYKDPRGENIFTGSTGGVTSVTGVGSDKNGKAKLELEEKVRELERKISIQAQHIDMKEVDHESSLAVKNDGVANMLFTQEQDINSYSIID